MKTIILNGSPKLNPQDSNTRFLCDAFVSGMQNPCEIKRIVGSDYAQLANYIKDFDNIIFIFPLYVHAVPGIVMKFIETMTPADSGKSIGFIIQSGFSETQQHKYITPYLKRLAEKLNYNYLGTVSKGECAGISAFPKAFKTTLETFARLGAKYDETGAFDKEIAAQMAVPYEFSTSMLRKIKIINKIGLDKFFWNNNLKKNNALDKVFDKPFA